MRRIVITGLLSASAALACSLPVQPTGNREEDRHADPRDIVGKARITLADAIARARAARPGAVVEAELEGEISEEKTEIFFEVMILGEDHELYEVRLDATTGGIQSNEEADEDEEEEVEEFLAVLRSSELSVEQLIAKAGQVVNGQAVSAGLELEHGNPVCEVTIVSGRYLIDATVEARAGHLVELELASGVRKRVDEEDEDGDEKDGEGGGEEEDEDDDDGGDEDLEGPGAVGR